jgi:hypothetical protein
MPNLSPIAVADRVREAGWDVDFYSVPPRFRAVRGHEKITALFGEDRKLVRARYFYREVDETIYTCLASKPMITGVLTVARSEPRDLPFDPTDDDATVLAALAGRTITWRSAHTTTPQTGNVPRGGLHLKLSYSGAGRCLTFVDHLGFHTVRLAAIEKVELT